MREACAMARFCDSNQKRGVTLVELIVVLVILAVLAALLVPSLTVISTKPLKSASCSRLAPS